MSYERDNKCCCTLLCDDLNGTGEPVPFFRCFEETCVPGQPVVREAVDYELDRETLYVLIGEAVVCLEPSDDHELVCLCDVNDGVVTSFLRSYIRDSAGVVTPVDTMLDGVTTYEVQGDVIKCDSIITWAETFCDIQTDIEAVTLIVTDTAAENVSLVDGLDGTLSDTHAEPGVDWTNGSFYDSLAGFYYAYDQLASEWYRYTANNLLAGPVNLGAFGGDPIVPNSFTFGTFDPVSGLGYVGSQRFSFFEINITLSTVTALTPLTDTLFPDELPGAMWLDSAGRYVVATLTNPRTTARIYTVDITTGDMTYVADFPLTNNISSGGFDLTNNTGYYGIDSTTRNLYRWSNLDASDIRLIGIPGTMPPSGTMDVVSSVTTEEILTAFQRVFHKNTETNEINTQDHLLNGTPYEVVGNAKPCTSALGGGSSGVSVVDVEVTTPTFDIPPETLSYSIFIESGVAVINGAPRPTGYVINQPPQSFGGQQLTYPTIAITGITGTVHISYVLL